jgi:S1-C subfamily serine protease
MRSYFLFTIKLIASIAIFLTLILPVSLGGHHALAQQQLQSPIPPQSTTAALTQGVLVDLARPAVVQVASLISGIVSVNEWGIDYSLMEQELEGLEEEELLDREDPQSLEYWQMSIFLQNPNAYIAPLNNIYQVEAQSGSTGSGFIVTPNGYIVTNAHVVAMPEDTGSQLVVSAMESSVLPTDFEWLNSYTSRLGLAPTEEQVNAYSDALIQYYSSTTTIDSATSEAYVLSRYSIPGVQTGEQPIRAEVIPHATGTPIPGKDVAVIKIEATNLPTLPLGNETALQPLDDLIVIGYPGAVSTNPVLSPTGQEPSVITGEFSGYQTTIEGWSAMQVQAPIAHGNSGGPALDSSGRVVGIATFGSLDPNTLQESPGFNFLVPVSIVKDYLNRANVQPNESQFTTMYRQALTEYSAGDFQESLNILQQINALSPNNPYILNYIAKAQQGAAAPSNFPNPPQIGNQNLTR